MCCVHRRLLDPLPHYAGSGWEAHVLSGTSSGTVRWCRPSGPVELLPHRERSESAHTICVILNRPLQIFHPHNPFLKVPFIIILIYRASFPSSLLPFFRLFCLICVHFYPHEYYILLPSLPPLFDHPNEEYKLCSFSFFILLHPPVTSSLLDPNSPRSIPFSDTLHLLPSFRLRDQVSRLYKT
jgi:hypothetical protein